MFFVKNNATDTVHKINEMDKWGLIRSYDCKVNIQLIRSHDSKLNIHDKVERIKVKRLRNTLEKEAKGR